MTPLKSHTPENLLRNTISYFSFFGFAPTFSEIFTFYPKKMSRKQLKLVLDRLVSQKKIIDSRKLLKITEIKAKNDEIELYNNLNDTISVLNFPLSIPLLYTLPQYSTFFNNRALRQSICQKKLESVQHFIAFMKKLPFITFVAVTGSSSMGNTRKSDDVDLFVITSAHSLFISRFCAIVLSYIFNVRSGKNSVCLNLFFDEKNIAIQRSKQTSYVAHEVLQMKPFIDNNNTYGRFLKSNKWVYKFFPNSRSRHADENPNSKLNRFRIRSGMTYVLLLLWPVEFILKIIQLAIIRKNKTGLILSSTQLWLFKNDFEKRIKQPIL